MTSKPTRTEAKAALGELGPDELHAVNALAIRGQLRRSNVTSATAGTIGWAPAAELARRGLAVIDKADGVNVTAEPTELGRLVAEEAAR